MTWVRLDDTALEDAQFLRLSRSARLLHLEALAWSNRTLADGFIPATAVHRLTDDPDPELINELVDNGTWLAEQSGFRLAFQLERQPTRERVLKDREEQRVRTERSRERKERHLGGDHSMCLKSWCPKATPNAVTNPVTNAVGNESPSRPDPSSPYGDGKGRPGGGSEAPPSVPDDALAGDDGTWWVIDNESNSMHQVWPPTRDNPGSRESGG
jgi:hypothetical protein